MKRRCTLAGTALLVALAPGCGAAARTIVHAPGDPTAAIVPGDSTRIAAWLSAAVALREDDPEHAVARLDTAVHAAPDDGALRLRYAAALQRAGDPDAAELQCRVAEQLDVAASARAPVCAPALAALGEPDQAWALWLDGARDDDATTRYFDTWFAAAAAQDPVAGVAAAERYVERFAQTPAAWRALGVARRTAGQHGAASEAFGQAAALPGGDGWDGEQAIVEALADDDADAAAAFAALCTARYREHIPCTVLAVTVADGTEARQAAIERLAQRVAGDGGRIRTAGRGLLERGMADVVEPWLREVAALRPRNVASLSAAAWMAASAGLRDLSVELMHAVLAVDRTHFDALNFVAYEWAERAMRLDEAEAYALEARRLRPDDSNIADTLAWVLFRQGRFAEAVTLQEQAVRVSPEAAVLLDHLGDIYRALGRDAEAIKAWQRAMQFATPADEDVLTTVPAKLEELGAPVIPHPAQ